MSTDIITFEEIFTNKKSLNEILEFWNNNKIVINNYLRGKEIETSIIRGEIRILDAPLKHLDEEILEAGRKILFGAAEKADKKIKEMNIDVDTYKKVLSEKSRNLINKLFSLERIKTKDEKLVSSISRGIPSEIYEAYMTWKREPSPHAKALGTVCYRDYSTNRYILTKMDVDIGFTYHFQLYPMVVMERKPRVQEIFAYLLAVRLDKYRDEESKIFQFK